MSYCVELNNYQTVQMVNLFKDADHEEIHVFTKLVEDGCILHLFLHGDSSDISSNLSKPKTSTGTNCDTKSQTELEPGENQYEPNKATWL